MEKNEIIERYNTAKYILEISYGQLERYDAKTNQLLTLIGIDFTILGIFVSVFYGNVQFISPFFRIGFMVMIPIDLLLIILSLYVVKKTLSPHLKPVDHKPKMKHGLIFFADIEGSFSKEEYVKILLGNQQLVSSSNFEKNDPYAFYKCIIEDCAYDIYEQAEILRVKSNYIKKSYSYVFWATIITFIVVVLFSVFSLHGL